MYLWTSALALSSWFAALPEGQPCDPSACEFADYWSRFDPVNAALIPIDGALLMQGDNYSDGSLTQISMVVTLAGQPVAGALEETSVPALIAWRPTQPFEPGATYEVTGMVDNPAEVEHCGEDIALAFQFTVGLDASTPLAPPVVVVSEEIEVFPDLSLDDLVCCEGVVPARRPEEACSWFLDYPEGACAAETGTGVRRVTLDILPQVDAATAGQLAYTVWVGNMGYSYDLNSHWSHQSNGEFCTTVVVANLGTGDAESAPEQCHGAPPLDQVGPVAIDVAAEITCTAPLQTCELDATYDAWDPNRCMPWPPPSEPDGPTSGDPTTVGSESGSESSAGADAPVDHGCDCDSRDAGGRGPVALLGLLGLASRRRVAGVSTRHG